MKELLDRTMRRLQAALYGAARPAVLWSGGKDSTVLLALAREMVREIDVIQWRVPMLRHKWEFHDRLAAAWGLTVYDCAPVAAALCHGNGRIDVMEHYIIGEKTLVIARGTEPMEAGRPWVCGKDWLTRPKVGTMEFPWDRLLCGHKNCDVDPCSGPVPLRLDVLRPAGCAEVHYPLREWSEEDITRFTLERGLPWDANRYELRDGVLRTLADKHGNSDYYHACMRCIDEREGAFVECPKMRGLVVDNISSRVARHEPRHEYCSLRVQNGECDMGDAK